VKKGHTAILAALQTDTAATIYSRGDYEDVHAKAVFRPISEDDSNEGAI